MTDSIRRPRNGIEIVQGVRNRKLQFPINRGVVEGPSGRDLESSSPLDKGTNSKYLIKYCCYYVHSLFISLPHNEALLFS